MGTLSRLQDWQSALTASIDGDRPHPHLEAAAASHGGASLLDGCRVYRASSRGGRQAALTDVYPVCRRLLGDACFDGLAREFVRCHPSRQPDLNHFGGDFAGFVGEVVAGQEAFSQLPWLPDLVQLEWLCHSLYYCEDDPPSALDRLAATDGADIVLLTSRKIAWLRSEWPVQRIWHTHQGEEDPKEIALKSEDWCILVERIDYRAQVSEIDAGLWYLLDACRNGASVEQLASDPDARVERLGELLQRGWILVQPAA